MEHKVRRFLAIFLSIFTLLGPETLYAANYQWFQTDWSGGGTSATTGHDSTQNGQSLWDKFSSSDANVDTTSLPGQLSLSPRPASWTQSTGTDFNSGILTNIEVVGTGEAAYLKIKGYLLDLGTGVDGDLVVDGSFPGNSSENDVPLNQTYSNTNPFVIDTIKNYRNVTVQNGGVLSVSSLSLLPTPANFSIKKCSATTDPDCAGANSPDGTFGYAVTAVDSIGFESVRSNMISFNITGVDAPYITWSAVPGASFYRVYRASGNLFLEPFTSPSLICQTPDATVTKCIDTRNIPLPGAPHLRVSNLGTPTRTVSSTGGAIGPGSYYYVYTAVDYWGFETTVSTQTGPVTITSPVTTASVNIQVSPLLGASKYRVYRTTASGIYNNPSFVCETTTTSCTDTLVNPLSGAPPRSYDHASSLGSLRLKVSGTLTVDETSVIQTDVKGFPGSSSSFNSTHQGRAGVGPGAAGNRGGGAGHREYGLSNDNPLIPAAVGGPYGEEPRAPSYPGSGGASGSVSGGTSGKGGTGGGAIRITAKDMVISGSLSSHGEDGGDGAGYDSAGDKGDGGGGGSGGAITLDGETLAIQANGVLSAAGGVGGGSTQKFQYDLAGSGSDGRISLSTVHPPTGNVPPAAEIGDRGIYETAAQDLGPGGVRFKTIAWNADVPSGSRLRFQIASNMDNKTWIFVGPDGCMGSFYEITASGTQTPVLDIPSVDCNGKAVHNGDRYVKWKAILESPTIHPANSPVQDLSPIVRSVTVAYESNPSLQSLISSPYDTTDNANAVRRWTWLEDISQVGTDEVLQLRTSPDGSAWTPWYGSHDTTFSSSVGVTTITVANASGFTVGSRVTLINSSAQEEVKKITTIAAGNKITLDSPTIYLYLTGSTFTDTYTDPQGMETLNIKHRDGIDDRWIQYRVLLTTDSGFRTPVFLENRLGYLPADGTYQPDGVVDGNGDGTFGDGTCGGGPTPCYGVFDSGGGGASIRPVDPNFVGGQVTYSLFIQNDGSAPSSNLFNDGDLYTITYNIPSDVSGNWTVTIPGLVDEDLGLAGTQTTVKAGQSKPNDLVVMPSDYAPANSTQTIILNLRSENEYAKVDSIKATATVNPIYQADGIIEEMPLGNPATNPGNNIYDNTGGGGEELSPRLLPRGIR